MILRTLAVAAAALILSACQTASFADYAKAANDLDPGCYKDVQLQVTPILIFGWPLPVVAGTYRKVCNPEQAPQASLIRPGVVVGGITP